MAAGKLSARPDGSKGDPTRSLHPLASIAAESIRWFVGTAVLCPYVVAQAYLSAAIRFRHGRRPRRAFLRAFQEIHVLDMGELWALKPALQIAASGAHRAGYGNFRRIALPVLLTSLRYVGDCQWKELFESVSIVERDSLRDPAGSFSRMDYASRDHVPEL